MNAFAKCALPALAATLLAAADATAQNRTFVLMQESVSTSYMTEWMSPTQRAIAEALIDPIAVTQLASHMTLMTAGRYQRFVNLSGAACTRSTLLSTLIDETARGNVVDLAILGRGSNETLAMNAGPALTGATRTSLGTISLAGSIRSMLTDARAQRGAGFNFNLRLVYMNNSFSMTLNDDWLAIGAKTSIGVRRNNYMPEPTLRTFWSRFLESDFRTSEAVAAAYANSRGLWLLAPGYGAEDPATGLDKFEEAEPILAGNNHLIFHDQMQLAVGQIRTINVPANQLYRFPGVYMMSGQVYRISATGTWNNGGIACGPGGYTPGFFDGLRRHPSNMMRLIAQRSLYHDRTFEIDGSMVDVGASRDISTGSSGFLMLWANDASVGYLDNSGWVTVTIRRLQ